MVSTYRLQLGPDFTFRDARELVPYLAQLGVTACYCSPYLQAGPGSTHGYDICDHNALSSDLGGAAVYETFVAALRAHGLGQILDFVPNHMGIDPAANLWWRDVLENGPSSPFADFFDIDWDPIKPELQGKILLPILADQYGVVLERGELQLGVEHGGLVLAYGERRLPINPRQEPLVFEHGLDDLRARLGDEDADVREFLSILTALRNLPSSTERDPERVSERQREKEVARARLARLVASSAEIRGHVARAVRAFNGTPGDAASFDGLHELLERQAYRLAYWRTASDEINYRRFFDVNELAGVRMESEEVFERTHALVLTLVEQGAVTGLRLDHVDGLFDPSGYIARLQRAVRDRRPSDDLFYVVAEKILSDGETLPDDWQAMGTTGYDFLNDLNGIFVMREHGPRLRRIYQRLTGRREPLADVIYESKRLIVATSMASELNVLAHALNRLSEADRGCRDFTLNHCRRALVEVVACFPVYRTYVGSAGVRPSDRATIQTAVARARRRSPAMDASIFEFLQSILLAEPDGRGDEAISRRRLVFAMKFQQYTGPVQAKGVEDTAFYRDNALVSTNEVGGDLQRFGRSVQEFHEANLRRLERWPLAMITTATHDTKRGEDARARLNVLSEIPDGWRRAVGSWMRMNRGARTLVDGEFAPDRNDEYLFYQALLGAWPAEPAGSDVPSRAPADLVLRITQYLDKATKEAKVHTSWVNENAQYDRAVARFVEATLAGPRAAKFLAAFVPFARTIARAGMVNALAQLAVKVASPGVFDCYQGNEFWDLALVDPDNRRPVDYAARRAALDELEPWLTMAADESQSPASLPRAIGEWIERWEDGRIKLFVTARGLRLRREAPDLFLRGTYTPIWAHGPGSRYVVSFARQWLSRTLIVVAPRLSTQVPEVNGRLPVGDSVWTTTRLALPASLSAPAYRNALTGERLVPAMTAEGRTLELGQVLAACPVAWLVAIDGAAG